MEEEGEICGASQKLLLFIVLTVGLENYFKSKPINVYWAVKAPPPCCSKVLAPRM